MAIVNEPKRHLIKTNDIDGDGHNDSQKSYRLQDRELMTQNMP